MLAPAGHLLDPDLGSDYERPWRLAQGLAGRGLRVVIVARQAERVDELGLNVQLECPPGPAPTSPMRKIVDRANLYMHARRIAYREVASGRALVVHHLGPCGESSPSLIGRLSVPFVYGPVPAARSHDVQDDEWLSWLLSHDASAAEAWLSRIVAAPASLIGKWLWHKTINRADAVTVEARSQTNIAHPSTVVIRPGIDVDQFKPRDDSQPVAGRIVAVGRLLGRKGYDDLIRALHSVVRTLPSAHLVLVGSGPQEHALRLLARQLGVDASVTFTGNISRADLIRLLHSAEVFCHPAKWESFFPAAPLEAMACGLPMIVSSAGALPELVGNFAGLVHAPGDYRKLASDLVNVLSNGMLRLALGSAARSHIVDQFTWQAMCDAYLDLYQRMGRTLSLKRHHL